MVENENLNTNEETVYNDTNQDVIDPLGYLVELEFNDETDFNIDEYSEYIDALGRNNEMIKSEEADEIIKNIGNKFIDKDYLVLLEKTHKNNKSFYKKYDPNFEFIKNMTEIEKTNLYTIGNFLNKNYSHLIDELIFDINLTRDEYLFLSNAIEKKLSYDGNEVFNIIELNENYLKVWKEEFKNLSKSENYFNIKINIKNIVMIYHFLQKYSVKGLSSEFYNFSSILKKISETNKIYNAFNIKKERLNSSFMLWTTAITTENIQ